MEAFRNGTWIGGHVGDGSIEDWRRKFASLRAANIDAVLLQLDAAQLAPLIPVAADEGIEIHAWMATMMQAGMEDEHHEWYVVNRNGDSAADKPAYVDYYKFMCPSRKPVLEHLEKQVAELASIEGLGSVHLDYIRYPDVILPIQLWDKYGIVQDKEYPEYDYCYCEVCREQFKQESGVDPLEIEDPASHQPWLQYRYDTITRVVNELAEVAHERGMPITAAVFPTPDIAKTLVRQDWVNWNLDAVMPMIYHSFYNEPVEWIEQATREGVEALGGKMPLYAGLFIPALTPIELAQAVQHSAAGGARGVVLFEGKMPTDEHWSKFAAAVERVD
jgi:uncharacterized lipoprotein YddW (UPF0748 family)